MTRKGRDLPTQYELASLATGMRHSLPRCLRSAQLQSF